MDDLEGESQELWLVQPPSLIGCLQRRSFRPASDLKSSSISRRSERACTEMTRSASDDLSFDALRHSSLAPHGYTAVVVFKLVYGKIWPFVSHGDPYAKHPRYATRGIPRNSSRVFERPELPAPHTVGMWQ